MKTLILIAHRGGAAFYDKQGPERRLELREILDHPAGRMKESEIKSDREGQSFNSNPRGCHANIYGSEHAVKTNVTRAFAARLAQRLEHYALGSEYRRMVIAAEPRLLGMLRAEMGPNTRRKVARIIRKDLAKTSEHDLPMVLEKAAQNA